MKIDLEPGKYVAAISGGVDSMVLLDLVRQQPGVELVVAHFDHGIRPDSAKDRKLVQAAAKKQGMDFVYEEGKLGAGASEDKARKARYEFLHKVKKQSDAQAIITAHHQDDMLETAILNMLRGTGRKGLSSLQSTDVIKRPLLQYTKQELIDYAKTHHIEWREDITNQDTAYLRNYIRKNIVPKLGPKKRTKLVKLIADMQEKNHELDLQIANYLQFKEKDINKIDRKRFIGLPHDVACEAMAAWLRLNSIRDFDRKTIERLVVAAKTYRPSQRADINKSYYIMIEKAGLALKSFDR